MSENSKEKRPHGWFFKNFIVGIIFLYVVWVIVLLFGLKFRELEGLTKLAPFAIAIVPGICGAMGYVLVKLWQDWLYSHFVFFTKINPITIFLFRYIIYPAIGCLLFPFALFAGLYLLYLKIKGEL